MVLDQNQQKHTERGERYSINKNVTPHIRAESYARAVIEHASAVVTGARDDAAAVGKRCRAAARHQRGSAHSQTDGDDARKRMNV